MARDTRRFRIDLVHALRQLGRGRGFAIASVAILAIAIGANTTIFSAADHILLRPLPYAEPNRIVTLWETEPKRDQWKRDVSPGNFVEWQRRTSSFQSMGLAQPTSADLTGDGPPEAIPAWAVTDGFFDALGVRPIEGRLFAPAEYLTGAAPAAMISEGLWRRRFGGDPSIVGRKLTFEGQPVTVVGVLPSTLEYPEPEDLWFPNALSEADQKDRRSSYMSAVARLKPGVSIEQARADMRRVAGNLAKEFPDTNRDLGADVVSLEEHVLGGVRPALLILLVAVGLVLLIACANVAGLLLARGARRARELAVRAALGAGRARLVQQLATESVLLAVLSGVAGIGLAFLGVLGLRHFAPSDLPRLQTVVIDGRVLFFALAMTVLTALLFGILPALRFSRPHVAMALRSAGRSVTGGRERTLMRSIIVTCEIALALVLLVGAGLLGRSFLVLLSNDLGFQTKNRATLQLFIWDRAETAEIRRQRVADLTERFLATPGVEGVAVVSALPFHPHQIASQSKLHIEGTPDMGADAERVYTTVASGGYFQVMGIALKRGRAFAKTDGHDAPLVTVINETLARRFFPGEDPVGKRVTVGVMGRPAMREIVGVVADVRPVALDSDPRPELFVPYEQSGTGSITFVVRTSIDAASFLSLLQGRIWEVDPQQTIYYAATMETLVSRTVVARRFQLVLLGIFSLIALGLATAGVYGLISYTIGQRTSEIGVRMALGARAGEIIALIVREGIALASAGVLAGVVTSLLLTRYLSGMLYGVSPFDPATFVQLAVLLILLSAAASFFPALRIVRLDPLKALREE
ncbi:MAG TPA: ABC transporter permease [Thermoanaerobaculia bacterium]|nr:ABC transporter permease [Thermoanaerobaculia bacterium]